MIACVDVDYKSDKACAACIVFEKWDSCFIYSSYKVIVDAVADYEPGKFYKRELPCITEVLSLVKEELEAVVIDGYVWLSSDKKPGLGWYLYTFFRGEIPVVGVAKTKYKLENVQALKVFRGMSKNPLYITAVGMELNSAAENVGKMCGEYRIPSVLKKVDKLCRSW